MLLVLLTRGTREEKIKFIYGVLAAESGGYIERGDLSRFCLDWENGFLPNSLNLLFSEGSCFSPLKNLNAFNHFSDTVITSLIRISN